MTPLGRIIADRIRASGPLSLADYMADCLMHPRHGYYATRDPFGAAGDFVTAPEISQMFGELVGLSLAQSWLDQGAPSGVVLAELGPGRGTLMADALRATRRVPGFHAALEVHLVETSPSLRAAQAQRVPQAIWHDTVADLPERPLWLVANEFFDALPIRQFVRDGDGWRERLVALADDRLGFALSDRAVLPDLGHRLGDVPQGAMVETCPALAPIATDIARRIARRGGAALVIDYGHWRSQGDTLQALERHRAVDPLDRPGEADLTAHVDFEALADAASPAQTSAMTSQGAFLERLGITERARILARGLTGEGLAAHVAAHRRLTHPAEMGDLFKVIGFAPMGAKLPPGTEP
jgi:SAM-dependent MidA family methyltransferase